MAPRTIIGFVLVACLSGQLYQHTVTGADKKLPSWVHGALPGLPYGVEGYATLLERADVIKDLQMNAKEKNNVIRWKNQRLIDKAEMKKNLHTNMRRFAEASKTGGDEQSNARSILRDNIKGSLQMENEYAMTLRKILGTKWTRLQQIYLQARGVNEIAKDKQLQVLLNLSDAQIKELRHLSQLAFSTRHKRTVELRQRQSAARAGINNKTHEDEEIHAKNEPEQQLLADQTPAKISTEVDRKNSEDIYMLLNKSQATQFGKLLGKEHNFKPDDK